jgi:VIT1/CCC1 family predicted Fe2+/Mn2+ transporter
VVEGEVALITAAVLGGLAIFGSGAGITRLTRISLVRSELRQLAFAASATAISYDIGRPVGSAVH